MTYACKHTFVVPEMAKRTVNLKRGPASKWLVAGPALLRATSWLCKGPLFQTCKGPLFGSVNLGRGRTGVASMCWPVGERRAKEEQKKRYVGLVSLLARLKAPETPLPDLLLGLGLVYLLIEPKKTVKPQVAIVLPHWHPYHFGRTIHLPNNYQYVLRHIYVGYMILKPYQE